MIIHATPRVHPSIFLFVSIVNHSGNGAYHIVNRSLGFCLSAPDDARRCVATTKARGRAETFYPVALPSPANNRVAFRTAHGTYLSQNDHGVLTQVPRHDGWGTPFELFLNTTPQGVAIPNPSTTPSTPIPTPTSFYPGHTPIVPPSSVVAAASVPLSATTPTTNYPGAQRPSLSRPNSIATAPPLPSSTPTIAVMPPSTPRLIPLPVATAVAVPSSTPITITQYSSPHHLHALIPGTLPTMRPCDGCRKLIANAYAVILHSTTHSQFITNLTMPSLVLSGNRYIVYTMQLCHM
jgi:hypothetical protein